MNVILFFAGLFAGVSALIYYVYHNSTDEKKLELVEHWRQMGKPQSWFAVVLAILAYFLFFGPKARG